MIITQITVYGCSDAACNATEVVRTDSEVDRFAESWFAGDSIDFCPKCRHKLSNQAAIAAEEELMGGEPEGWKVRIARIFARAAGRNHATAR